MTLASTRHWGPPAVSSSLGSPYTAKMTLPDSAKDLIRSGALGHMVTIGKTGAPHVTCVWVAVDGEDLLTAHLNPNQRKLANVRRDPRVTLSFEGSKLRPPGLREYLIVRGTASIEDGGAPELLQELAHVHLGPDVKFPPMDEPPPGVRMRITVEHVGGVGSWGD
jgi:PPOX class probable F420-dependent enzyme